MIVLVNQIGLLQHEEDMAMPHWLFTFMYANMRMPLACVPAT